MEGQSWGHYKLQFELTIVVLGVKLSFATCVYVYTDGQTDNAKTVSHLPLAGDRKQFSGREYDLDDCIEFLM